MPVSTRSSAQPVSAPAPAPAAAAATAAQPPATRSNASAIPGMPTSTLRALLGAQRKAWDGEFIKLHDQVTPEMSRLQFNYLYVLGVAHRRHQKHRREAQRNH